MRKRLLSFVEKPPHNPSNKKSRKGGAWLCVVVII